jgi:hypothetical protein
VWRPHPTLFAPVPHPPARLTQAVGVLQNYFDFAAWHQPTLDSQFGRLRPKSVEVKSIKVADASNKVFECGRNFPAKNF